MSCVIKCIVCGNQARVKNADLRHPSCTVIMCRRTSASPVHNVLMYGCCENCVGVLAICVLVFTLFLCCFVYVYLFLFVTSVRTTATEWKLSCNK
jgi:hypothetical protein